MSTITMSKALRSIILHLVCIVDIFTRHSRSYKNRNEKFETQMPTTNKYPICVAAAALAAMHTNFPLILASKTIQFSWISNLFRFLSLFVTSHGERMTEIIMETEKKNSGKLIQHKNMEHNIEVVLQFTHARHQLNSFTRWTPPRQHTHTYIHRRELSLIELHLNDFSLHMQNPIDTTL